MTENKNKPALVEGEAKELYRAGKFQKAADGFSQAADLFLAGGDAILAAEMKNNQSVALLKAKKPRLALDAVRGTAEDIPSGRRSLKRSYGLGQSSDRFEGLGKKAGSSR